MTARKAATPAFLRAVALCMILAGSGAGGVAQAQTYDSANAGPFRTSTDGADSNLILEGHDAVAYFTQNEAVKGDPAIRTEHLGVVYRFVSEANKAEFLRSPQRYLPQFGGFCSNGINYAIPWGGGGAPNTWRIYRGKLYVFGGQASRDHFEMDTERNLALAHKYWDEEVAGSVAFLKRYQRLIFRVPHYKTGKELQDEWQAKLDAKTLPVMPGAPQVVPAK
jgi:YHS domain-containing protein